MTREIELLHLISLFLAPWPQRQEYLRQNGRLPEAGVGMVITER